MQHYILNSEYNKFIQKDDYYLFIAYFGTPKITFKGDFKRLLNSVALLFILLGHTTLKYFCFDFPNEMQPQLKLRFPGN